MLGKLPPEFDASWYATNYRDVALSGLSPRQHYLRFGRILGRRVSGPPPRAGGSAEPAPAQPAERLDSPPAPPTLASPLPKIGDSPPIIDRPDGFDPAELIPQPAPPRPGGDSNLAFSLESIAVAAPGSAVERTAIGPALQAYARLQRLQVPNGMDAKAGTGCGAATFQTDPARIENAWLADDSRLRLMLAGGAAASDPLAIRAYQAEPASPAELRMLGAGIELPPQGPVFHDLELLHPLMPLLLELADADGVTRGISLMPFPSLLPGGLHAAELRAVQNEPNPMDAFWSLSELLLQETVGREGWADRSVTGVTGNGDEALSQPVQDWLSAIFGLTVDAGQQDGLRLFLPRDSVPTISALASRRLDAGDGTSLSGPYLIAEAGSYRPRWSIALPADQLAGAAVPLLRPAGTSGDAIPATRLAPIHLAIALRSPSAPAPPAVAPEGDTTSSAVPGGLSVVVSGSDAAQMERLVQSIRAAVAGEVEFLLRTPHPFETLTAALDRACEGQGWVPAPAGAELREIASQARHGTLLTISDRIGLGGRILPALLKLLQRDESVGSASCALLSEKIIKKQVVLQPASGGLFPTRVSFASAPRLSFGEPDVLQALPGLAYPVVANTLLLTVWRTGALAALPRPSGPVSSAGEEIRLGLDLMQAGYRNWCTTQVSASLSGPYAPRDTIDPVGEAYLQPERWEEILDRVSVVRELF